MKIIIFFVLVCLACVSANIVKSSVKNEYAYASFVNQIPNGPCNDTISLFLQLYSYESKNTGTSKIAESTLYASYSYFNCSQSPSDPSQNNIFTSANLTQCDFSFNGIESAQVMKSITAETGEDVSLSAVWSGNGKVFTNKNHGENTGPHYTYHFESKGKFQNGDAEATLIVNGFTTQFTQLKTATIGKASSGTLKHTFH